MLISVITINYNNKEGLLKTMESVFNQSFDDYEYIIIDGGSDDGSKKYLELNSKQINFWVSEKDRGIYNAMNKGIKSAKGNYLLFLNSGDVFYSKNSLKSFESHIKKSQSQDIIYGNIEVVSDKKWIKKYPQKLNFKYFVKDTLPHPATLIKRACFDDFLYDENLKIVSDWKFFIIGICKKKFSYKYINQVISIFYLDGISSNQPKIIEKEKKQVLNKSFYFQLYKYKITQKIYRLFSTQNSYYI